MAPKKKQKDGRNGFYYFMLEVQRKENKAGNRYNLSEISEIANPIWSVSFYKLSKTDNFYKYIIINVFIISNSLNLVSRLNILELLGIFRGDKVEN